MSGFIAVHCGAGYHSESLSKEYKKLCHKACRSADDILKQNGNAMDAVEAAIIVLENSHLTNAGFGSNLTWEGTVECDASVMNGQTLHFGACGAVSNVYNPISLAKKLCLKQCESLSLGRVPPSILTGSGARLWAEQSDLEIVDDKKMVSARAFRNFKHCRKKLKKYSQQFDLNFSPLDTVGAVCIDADGFVAAGASSGGVALKHQGRIGQAASFGSGVWAAMSNMCNSKYSVASCTSGCGEHLIRTQLAKNIAECLDGECPTTAMAKCLKDKFYESPFLWDIPEKLGGAIALRYDPTEGCGEFLWGHSTPSMCIGYMPVSGQPKCVMSYLPPNMKAGKKAVVSGLPFTIPIKPSPQVQIQWQIKTD